MTVSNETLIERFVAQRGAELGSACNMSIARNQHNWALLVGYAHAVYAAAPPGDRHAPVVHTGWDGASKSTTQHINLLDARAPEAWTRQSGRPNTGDYGADPSLEAVMAFGGNDKDYSTPHRSYR